MPIQTNFAVETAFFHVPIPATKSEVRQLNAIWNRQPPKNGRIVAKHTKQGMILEAAKPVVMVAVADEYWRAIGRLVKRTREPWWDLCAIVLDSEVQSKKPQAHALSLYRITAKGKLNYLVSEEPESLWPEAYASRPKRKPSRRSSAKRGKKWQFAPDLLGIFSGPKILSTREGFAHR
jgi:hypothetical protein